jgi:hypothetical protein
MPTKITLNVFSGRPNPTWTLSNKEDKALTERLAALDQATDKRPSGVFGGLGYRGFTISRPAAHPGGKLAMTVHESVVDRHLGDFNLVDDTALESFLTETGKAAVPDLVAEHVKQQLTAASAVAFKLPVHAAAAVKCPVCKAVDAPAYNPGPWNVNPVLTNNNCYNYANNKITNTFAQPGKAHGKQAKVMACANVQAAAQADGLVPVANFAGALAKGKGWYVALVIWPNADYHWYRQDSVGCWSHKPGRTAARNVDNAGAAIVDPKTCNRGPYVNFCTYMVTRAGIVIR